MRPGSGLCSLVSGLCSLMLEAGNYSLVVPRLRALTLRCAWARSSPWRWRVAPDAASWSERVARNLWGTTAKPVSGTISPRANRSRSSPSTILGSRRGEWIAGVARVAERRDLAIRIGVEGQAHVPRQRFGVLVEVERHFVHALVGDPECPITVGSPCDEVDRPIGQQPEHHETFGRSTIEPGGGSFERLVVDQQRPRLSHAPHFCRGSTPVA